MTQCYDRPFTKLNPRNRTE